MLKMKRRELLGLMGPGIPALAMTGTVSGTTAQKSTNILWISCEDISPDLGCYGSTEVSTPHIDRLASEGLRYTNAFTVATVCAPNRSGIITCMYPPSTGSVNMRTKNEEHAL